MDVILQYAKDEDDADAMSIRITAYNRGPDAATLHIVPQLWFRNVWSWPKDRPTGKHMPSMHKAAEGVIQADQEDLGRYFLHCTASPAPIAEGDENGITEEEVVPELMFTENDTNLERLYGGVNVRPFVKDGFHDHIIASHRPAVVATPAPAAAAEIPGPASTAESPRLDGSSESDATSTGSTTPTLESANHFDSQPPHRHFVNPENKGTKAGAHYTFANVPGNGGCAVVRLKLTKKTADQDSSIQDEEAFDATVEERRADADEFYSRFNSGALSDDLRNIMRQALSGMLWTKQFYMFIQKEWIEGDPGQPPPPPERKGIRNQVSLPLSDFYRGAVPDTDIPCTALSNGNTCTLKMSCPCPTSGNTPFSPFGILYVLAVSILFPALLMSVQFICRLSTVFRSPWSIRPTPRNSLIL